MTVRFKDFFLEMIIICKLLLLSIKYSLSMSPRPNFPHSMGVGKCQNRLFTSPGSVMPTYLIRPCWTFPTVLSNFLK